MELINGLLDYTSPWTLPNIYLFTGNSVIKNNGAIVMGRGAAKQVRDTYPGIDNDFGTAIQERPNVNIVWSLMAKGQWLGWFKVKNHWRDNANILLIQDSVNQLTRIATKKPEITFHMNYPGIGNGKLKIEDVEDILSILPDNVRIYK